MHSVSIVHPLRCCAALASVWLCSIAVGESSAISAGHAWTFESTTDGWQPRAGESCTLSIRPESWRLATQSGAPNEVAGRLTERVYLGEMAQYQFAAGPQVLKVFELNPRFVELSPERELFASADPADVIALPV